VVTGPDGFDALFPGTGGALYGKANHGMLGSFSRPGARSRLPGLYLAGGSVHPGAGVPMATLSGRLARGSHGVPVRSGVEVRNRRQNIETVAALRRQRRVIGCRAMKIEAEILGENLVAEDILQQATISGAKDNRMMVAIRILTPSSEVPDKKTHGIVGFGDFPVGPDAPRRVAQQLRIGPANFSIGDNEVATDHLAACETHACHAAALSQDFVNLSVQAKRIALPFNQANHTADQLTGAADGVMNTPDAFEM
jgi:hypothetical protein